MEAFVAEDVDDMNLLMKVLRDDLKLRKISVVNSRLVSLQRLSALELQLAHEWLFQFVIGHLLLKNHFLNGPITK